MLIRSRRSHAEQEIVAGIEAFGEELCGDPHAIANVLEALVGAIGRSAMAGEQINAPDYAAYEDSDYGRMMADADYASRRAWQGLRDELASMAKELRNNEEYRV